MSLDHDDVTRSVRGIGVGDMFGRYRVLRHLGAGGMGDVYLAEDVELHRQVALKFLVGADTANSELRARFHREAQAAARLNHPNIVTVYEVGEQSGRPYIAMEHVDGHSLHHHAHAKPLGLEQVLELMAQVATGLAKAHQHGVIHRDIKCANIIVDTDGRARILDFGLAAMHDADRLTRPGTTLGTVAYMSPEQVRGQEVDHRSDLFSLGIVLYELIAGRSPFKRDTEAATLQAILTEQAEPLSRYKAGMPVELQQVVDKALEKDPALRYQSAADICADVRRIQRSLASGVSVAAAAAPVAPPPRKRSLLRIAVPGSVVVVLLVIALVLKPWRFEISSTDKAAAAEDRLAVMYFDNMVNPEDPDRLGEILTNLAITGLSETKSLQVVSSQRLYDILKQLGREGEKRVDREVASQIAERAQASKMLIGSVLQTTPRLVVTTQVIDVATGGVLSSQRIVSEPSDDVFSLVDKLTSEVGQDLTVAASAGTSGTISVADVTTHSPEAYRLYLEGEELFHKVYLIEARGKFLEAVRLDSTFAKAWLALARHNEDASREVFVAKAMAHRDRASERDKRLIEALNAQLHSDFDDYYRRMIALCEDYPDDKLLHFSLGVVCLTHGRLQDALTYVTRSVELDPLFKTGYNILAYIRMDSGDTAGAFAAVERYASLAPHEPNPYDTRGDLYSYMGQVDRATESYKVTLQKAPDFFLTRIKLGDLYLFYGHMDSAHLFWEPLHTSAEHAHRVAGRIAHTLMQTFTGQYAGAEQSAIAGLHTDTLDKGFGPDYSFKLHLHATAVLRSGRIEEAARHAETAAHALLKENPRVLPRSAHFIVEMLLQAGKAEDAQRILEEAKHFAEVNENSAYAYYLVAVARVQMAQNDRAAITTLQQAIDTADAPWFLGRYVLGRAYLQFSRPREAVEVLESIGRSYDERWSADAPAGSDYYYYLAQAYDRAGQHAKAAASYERYLDIMSQADGGVAEVVDARVRLRVLGAKM